MCIRDRLGEVAKGDIIVDGKAISDIDIRTFARLVAFVNTERVDIDSMRAYDLVAIGRSPYTDWMGRLTKRDREIIERSMQITGVDKLAERMMRTDRVRITGPGTDLTFSIKGMPAHPCAGEMNIPDGEVFTAPIKDSVNGTIHYTAPTLFQGIPFDGIRLTFKDGKIVEAHCNGNEEALNKILDTDEGSRFIGEFALGVNPFILKPMRDILFDEKIGGSFHFTPGQAYENCDNGNRSQVHWDMVCIQRADYGGGEIWFDDELIRKDGIFTDSELDILNPKMSE